MNSEAELATVLGHEVGHVTARHSVQQISKAQLATLGLGIGSILSSDVAQFAGVASQGLGRAVPQVRPRRGEPGRPAGVQVRARARTTTCGRWPTCSRPSTAPARSAGAGDGCRSGSPPTRTRRTGSSADRGAARHAAGVARQHPRRPRRVSPADRRHDLRRGSAAGLLRGDHLLPPRHAVPAPVPRGMEDPEHAVGGRRGEPEGGRDHPARPRRAPRRPREAASKFLSQQGVQAGRASTSSINGNQAATSYFQAQTEQGVIEGIVSFISLRREDVRADGLHAAGQSADLRRRASRRRSTASTSSGTRPRSRSSRPSSSW